MAPHGPSHGPSDDPVVESTGFRFGWAAALGGIFMAVAFQVVLSLLGIAIGFSWWSPEGVGTVGMAAGIWTILSWVVALFAGALIAGRLAGILTVGDGALHGLVIWAGSTLLAVYMIMGGVGFLAGTAFDLLGRAVGATTSAAVTGLTEVATSGASQAGELDLGALQDDVQRVLRQTGEPAVQPDTLEAVGERAGERLTEGDTERAAREIAGAVERAAGQLDRSDLVDVIAAETGLSRTEAENVAVEVERLTAQATQTVQTGMDTLGSRAERTAGEAANQVGSAAWWALLALALSAGGAVAGGAITARS